MSLKTPVSGLEGWFLREMVALGKWIVDESPRQTLVVGWGFFFSKPHWVQPCYWTRQFSWLRTTAWPSSLSFCPDIKWLCSINTPFFFPSYNYRSSFLGVGSSCTHLSAKRNSSCASSDLCPLLAVLSLKLQCCQIVVGKSSGIWALSTRWIVNYIGQQKNRNGRVQRQLCLTAAMIRHQLRKQRLLPGTCYLYSNCLG